MDKNAAPSVIVTFNIVSHGYEAIVQVDTREGKVSIGHITRDFSNTLDASEVVLNLIAKLYQTIPDVFNYITQEIEGKHNG